MWHRFTVKSIRGTAYPLGGLKGRDRYPVPRVTVFFCGRPGAFGGPWEYIYRGAWLPYPGTRRSGPNGEVWTSPRRKSPRLETARLRAAARPSAAKADAG